jgi:hypothetical protein
MATSTRNYPTTAALRAAAWRAGMSFLVGALIGLTSGACSGVVAGIVTNGVLWRDAVIAVHLAKEVRRQLKTLAAEQDRTVDDMVAEALNLLFAKYRRAEIAPRKHKD